MGDNFPTGSPWVGSDGAIANPDAPNGGGGPGAARMAGPLSGDPDPKALPHPSSPDGREIIPPSPEELDVKEIDPPNAPPKTMPEKFTMKSLNDARNEIEVKGEVLADGTATLGMGAETRLTPTALVPSYPEYEADAAGDNKILVEKTKFILKGTVTIQVVYDPNGSAKEVARYGRGTTVEDKAAKNTTSGFHESCHVSDYKTWLKTKPLPVFTGKVGQPKKTYDAACDQFQKDLDKYFADAEKDSETKTDEVGYKKSQFIADQKKKQSTP